MYRYLCITVMLLLSTVARADSDLYVSTTIGSYHFDTKEKYHEDNRGIGIEVDNFVFGFYKNSARQDTYYFGYAWRPIEFQYVKVGIMLGIGTGYNGPLMAIPTMNIGTESISVDVMFIPPTSFMPPAIGASLKFKVW